MDVSYLADPAVVMAFTWEWWKIVLIVVVVALLVAAFVVRRGDAAKEAPEDPSRKGSNNKA